MKLEDYKRSSEILGGFCREVDAYLFRQANKGSVFSFKEWCAIYVLSQMVYSGDTPKGEELPENMVMLRNYIATGLKSGAWDGASESFNRKVFAYG